MDTEVISAVTCDEIKKATRPVLSKVYTFVLDGWPNSFFDPQFRPYKERQHELSVEEGCILWGMRVVVPDCLRTKVLDELHETHPGIIRIKAIARSFVWWPNLDVQIERKVADCFICQAMKPNPPTASLHHWFYSSKPWSRMHVDYAGPMNGSMYLVVVCADSKYPEVIRMKSTTSTATYRFTRVV